MSLLSVIIGREHALAKDAKKGLESKEDIHGASKGLRVTEKDRTGVGTEKTNPYDGVKDVMFFHIKGSYLFLLLLCVLCFIISKLTPYKLFNKCQVHANEAH